MAVQSKRLNSRSVDTIKKPGRHADGGNLYLNVTATGAKSWVFMFKFEGRQREMGLGPAREISLAKARDLAGQHRQAVRDGIDPLKARRAVAIKPTFGEFAKKHIDTKEGAWRSIGHRQQWRMTLFVHAASLSNIPIDKVDTDDVLRALRPIWSTKAETASRLRGRIESVLNAAKAEGLRSGDNPAAWAGHLKNILPPARPKGSRGRYEAAAIDDVSPFMRDLATIETASARALVFTILTAARSGEALGARWNEIDLERRAWTIPAIRMKAGVEHRVPLSARAIEVLTHMTERRSSDFVFPGRRPDTSLNDTVLSRTLKRLRPDITVHGFRSSFRDWASERTGFPSDVCEAALAHTVRNATEAAYRRGDLFEKRRHLMEAWADFICPQATESKVVPLPMRQSA